MMTAGLEPERYTEIPVTATDSQLASRVIAQWSS
jgi:hypothetical protein